MTNPLINSLGRGIEKRRFSDEPIIIAACPRSGTTLLLSILDAHPHIYAIQRQTYCFDAWERKNGPPDGEAMESPARIDRLYRYFLTHKIPGGVTRWCEKTPKHVKNFERILEYFHGKARLIHIIRDGRDVITSKHPRHTPGEYWVSPERWVEDVELGLRFADHPAVLTVFYEHVVKDYVNVIEKICRFLGEECVPALYSWVDHTGVKKSKHWANPVQDLHSQAIGRWKQSGHESRIEEFMSNEKAVALLRRLDYHYSAR